MSDPSSSARKPTNPKQSRTPTRRPKSLVKSAATSRCTGRIGRGNRSIPKRWTAIELPRLSVLYPGCVLGAIVNAIAYLDHGSWCRFFVDDTYAYDGGDGDHFMISFENDNVVGTLYNH